MERLPGAIVGWRVEGEDRHYDREGLYDYIDGGAELYLSYGFERLWSRTYSRSGHPDLVVDLFLMGSPGNAFGVFSHSRETVDEAFGQGSQYTEGLLLFWKNRYFVSILASPESEETREAMFAVARSIDEAIPTEGNLPPILSLLPCESLVEESVRYFHHHVWLNSHYYISDENILHIDRDTEVVLAKYGEKGRRSVLLLAGYRSAKKAEKAYRAFKIGYLPELSREPVVRIEDGTWTGCRLKGEFLTVIFNASTKFEAETLLGKVEKSIVSRERR
jgi:hypothetical protein